MVHFSSELSPLPSQVGTECVVSRSPRTTSAFVLRRSLVCLRSGFKAKVVSVEKTGQVHFSWNGKSDRLKQAFPDLKKELMCATHALTTNMRRRGGGVLDLSLIDMSHELENYHQLHVSFDTLDAMGANFINSCLEMMASTL